MAIATLVVSIVMTGLTFFALNGIQTEARMGDTRYARDLGLLLASNVTPLAAQGNDRELARVTEAFWRSRHGESAVCREVAACAVLHERG